MMPFTEEDSSMDTGSMLEDSGSGLDAFALAGALLRGKRLILLAGLVCAVLAWLVMLRVPTTFSSYVAILPPQISRIATASSMLSQAGYVPDASALGALTNSIQAKSQADTFVVIMSAWPIEDALVKRFHLADAYHQPNDVQARDVLVAHTLVKASKEGVLTITITDTDRRRCMQLANAHIDEARNFLRGLSLTEASQRRVFYEAQLAKTKDDLADAEMNFKQMQQTNGMVSLDTQARALMEGAATLRSQITAKEVELQSVRSYSTESNPQVQIQESELNALRGQLSQLESRGQGGYSGKALSSVPTSELAFVRASRELKYQEALYDLMVKQYEGSRIDEARDAPVIQIIEPAQLPAHKAGPHRFKIISAAFLLGGFLGTIFVGVRYWRAGLGAEQVGKFAELRRAAFRW